MENKDFATLGFDFLEDKPKNETDFMKELLKIFKDSEISAIKTDIAIINAKLDLIEKIITK